MCNNTQNQKQSKHNATIPKALLNARDNKTTNKTQAFINASKHSTKKEKKERRKRKLYLQLAPKIKIKKQPQQERITQAHKTKAFLNAPTQKHKQQPNLQQSIPTQTKTSKKQTQTTTQITHSKLKNHNISNLYTNQYKIIKHHNIQQKKVKTNTHKIKQNRPNGLTRKQNKHNIRKNTKQNRNLYKTTPKQNTIYKGHTNTHITYSPNKTKYIHTNSKQARPTGLAQNFKKT